MYLISLHNFISISYATLFVDVGQEAGMPGLSSGTAPLSDHRKQSAGSDSRKAVSAQKLAQVERQPFALVDLGGLRSACVFLWVGAIAYGGTP